MLPKIIYGAKIKLIPFATSTEPIPIIIPAITTPHITAITLFLNPRSRILAASVPVHAPVPGSGIPTNINNAKNKPVFPAFS